MSFRTNPLSCFAFMIIAAALGGTIAPATTIDIDGGSGVSDLVSPGDVWKYFKGTEPPSNPPNAWNTIGFDDSNWPSGPGGFGYGDNDDATVFDDMRGNYLSVFIRKEFSVSSVSGDEIVRFEIDYDDGFIAYLNGVEIARADMGEGAAGFDSRAASAHEAGSPQTFVLGPAGELLNEGVNVLAVQGHNSSASSSDFSLIPALRTSSNVIRAGERWIVETDTVTLKGRDISRETASVMADGAVADFNTFDKTWSVVISLAPGMNEITIEQLDANANAIRGRTVEIMYIPAENYFSGQLTEDTTWSGACVIEGTVIVPAGTVLKIEPATTVLMKDAAGIFVYGQLLAEGTEDEPIHFTRYAEGMSWKQIMFVEAADSRLANCIIEYADSEGEHQDYYGTGPRTYHEAVVALACHLDIENCVFQNLPDESGGADGDAIAIISDDQEHPGEATANIRGCQFLSIGQGVHTRYSYVLVEGCFFTGKRGDNDDVDLWGESTPAPLIINNIFLNPEHDDMINPTRCSALIVGNVIIGCDDHGVVLRDRCFPVLMNNLIVDCRNAGVAIENSCEALLINNTIVDCGRGLRLFDLGRWGPPYNLNPGGGTATVINCIIWDCPQPVTLADSSNTQIEDRGSHITVKYSDIQGGESGISVSGSRSSVTWGPGNINTDPQFAAGGDYHLKSQAGRWDTAGQRWVTDSITSPCVDAGDPGVPVAFEPYPNGSVINMGTYGGTDKASKSPSGIHAKYGGGTGISDNPYLIYTTLHMNTIGLHEDDVDKHFKMMADVDLGSLGEKDFNIIGIYPAAFRGVFDGNGHTVSNFRYISTDIDYAALFESVEGKDARIANLGMINPVINVESNELEIPTNPEDPNAGAGYGNTAGSLVNFLTFGASLSNCFVSGGSISGDLKVGGLVSYVEFGEVEGCYSTAEVSGKREIGGLAGHNLWGEITDCHTNSNVTGDNYAGGIAGFNDDSTIENCSASGDVMGGSTVGGLVGHNTGEISNSNSTGQITGTNDVGGLAGRNGGTITNSYSTGSATGEMYVGGLAGIINGPSTIANCRSTGDVTGVTIVGGLVGRGRGTITNCYSTGKTTGEEYVGGLAGILYDPTTVINCYSAGNVTGVTEVGGLVGGGDYMADVFGSFWDMEVSGQSMSFAGTGKATAEMQTAGTFLDAGWDFFDEMENGTDDIWWITEGQDYPRLWWELSD